MGAHAEFIYRLSDLVEYAEYHDLEVASLALKAAAEVIAPSIAQSISAQMQISQPSARPKLRLINGGRGLAEAC